MRRHPEIGAHMLAERAPDGDRALGAGPPRAAGRPRFPHGLSDGEIPLEARILAVADAYVAMTSERPYRAALDHDAARNELRKHSSEQFDSRVVEAFIESLAREEAAV